ncbi:MAG: helix-turn-helix domain-containing protein [Coriobacteriia bacterium]|nr:helix-turn-helix domain-containing protein [Coriobacteriia bacterium]
MTEQTELSRRIADSLDSADYETESLILSLTGEFLDLMDLTGTTRTELAARLGVKPPRVTRILQGNDNFTLRTIVRVADALGCRIVLTLEPRDAVAAAGQSAVGATGELAGERATVAKARRGAAAAHAVSR